MNARRILLIASSLAALAAALPAFAQPERRVRRIGFYTQGSAQTVAAALAAFREGMAELRWAEGRDYLIDARYADGVEQAGPGLAEELIATRPDLLLTPAEGGVRLLAQKTNTIPIVFAVSQDPVANRLVANLQRPGGNATGLTNLGRDLGAKRLQLLKQALPHIAHVGLMFDPADVGSVSEAKVIENAAGRLRMRVTPIGLREAADIEAAFKRGAALGVQAYIMPSSALASTQAPAILEHVLRSRLPAIFGNASRVEGGGLMSYSASITDNYRRAATYADKILKGAKPGDLPIEQPTKFELVVNLKTARAMGLSIPQSFLARADRVIE